MSSSSQGSCIGRFLKPIDSIVFVEGILEAYLPEAELAEVRRLLYGKVPSSLSISEEAHQLAEKHGYDIQCVSTDSS